MFAWREDNERLTISTRLDCPKLESQQCFETRIFSLVGRRVLLANHEDYLPFPDSRWRAMEQPLNDRHWPTCFSFKLRQIHDYRRQKLDLGN